MRPGDMEGELLKGGILVVVHCETDEETNRAKEVFQSSGAQDIATSQENFFRRDQERRLVTYPFKFRFSTKAFSRRAFYLWTDKYWPDQYREDCSVRFKKQ